MHSPSNTDIEILGDDTKALVPADPPILLCYDAACKAVAEAKRADEVLHIRDQARAMRAAAKIAKNRDIEIDAAEIRIRAERRLGELIQAQKETVGLNQGAMAGKTGTKGAPVLDERPTLADAGIDKKLSSRAQQYADIPRGQWENDLANWRAEQQESSAVCLFKPTKTRPPKPAPLIADVVTDPLRILVGDCRARLRELADKSVHSCITSPPYFGLRNFDVEPVIWGCDDPNCEHDWDNHQRPGNSGGTRRENVRIKGKDNFQIVAPSEYSVCGKCGAWRGCLGLEPTPELYVEHICQVFDEVARVLRDDGTVWIVIGDSYYTSPAGNKMPSGFSQNTGKRLAAGLQTYNSTKKQCGELKRKNLLLIPSRVALALQARGWILRADIIWHKPGVMPESATDRPTRSYEHILMFSKQEHYYYNAEAIKEPAISIDDRRKGTGRHEYNGKFGKAAFVVIPEDNKRNCRDVWTVSSEGGLPGYDHFAPFPRALVKPMIMAGCPEGGTVLDIFGGTGTTGLGGNAQGRKAILIEANPNYAAMALERINKELPEYMAKCAVEDAWGNAINQANADNDDDDVISEAAE